MLASDALADFLHVMYADEPVHWSATLAGNERLRFIINVLTRIRFVDAEARLDLKTKEGAGGAPPGFFPWFEPQPGPRCSFHAPTSSTAPNKNAEGSITAACFA